MVAIDNAVKSTKWVVRGDGLYFTVEREDFPYGLDGMGQRQLPFGTFTSRTFAQNTAGFANALEARLAAWEAAMTDVSVINWTLNEDNKEDLHKQLMAVIAETVQEALDPVVSEQAARLALVTADAEALALELRNVAHQADFGQGLESCWCKLEDEDGEAIHTESIRIRAVLANHEALINYV